MRSADISRHNGPPPLITWSRGSKLLPEVYYKKQMTGRGNCLRTEIRLLPVGALPAVLFAPAAGKVVVATLFVPTAFPRRFLTKRVVFWACFRVGSAVTKALADCNSRRSIIHTDLQVLFSLFGGSPPVRCPSLCSLIVALDRDTACLPQVVRCPRQRF